MPGSVRRRSEARQGNLSQPINSRYVSLAYPIGASPGDWAAAADELIGAGKTRIERDRVAAVLAELAEGTAPSTVARKVGVGYATVPRVAEASKRLELAATGTGPAIISTNGSGKVTS
jgi:hypothetical protein